MRLHHPVAMILTAFLLGSLVAACEPGPTETYVMIGTTGYLDAEFFAHVDEDRSFPVSGKMRGASESGDQHWYFPPGDYPPGVEPRPSSAIFTVAQAGFTTLAIEQWERETSSGLTADQWLRKQVFFAMSAPEGAEIELPFSHDTDPLEVQLKVDYDADGAVDAELSPLVAAEGEDLEGERPKVEPVVEETQQGQAIVSFTSALDSPNPVAIYYSLYPSQPQLQIYTEPVVIEQGSFILYGAVGPTGTRQPTRELEIMGGIAKDVELEVSVGGGPVDVSTMVPGQLIQITFHGERQQQVEVDVSAVTGGIEPRNQASLTILGPDGTILREVSKLGVNGIGENRWSDTLELPADGVYTIVIDPRLANVISTTATLSPTS